MDNENQPSLNEIIGEQNKKPTFTAAIAPKVDEPQEYTAGQPFSQANPYQKWFKEQEFSENSLPIKPTLIERLMNIDARFRT